MLWNGSCLVELAKAFQKIGRPDRHDKTLLSQPTADEVRTKLSRQGVQGAGINR